MSETNANGKTLKNLPEGFNPSKFDLSGTDVTDAGLDSLLRFEGLTNLGLGRTKVTSEGVARLKARWKGSRRLSVSTGTGTSPIINYAPFPK